MTDQASAGLISTAVKEIIQQSQSLGLTWNLQICTITTSTLNSLTVVFDGDVVAIAAVNITGFPLVAGDRVYCIVVPQSGNFVFGYVSNIAVIGYAATRAANQVIADSTSTAVIWDTQSFSSTGGFLVAGALPSATLTIPTGFDGIYSVTANALFNAAGTRNFLELSDNGSLWVRSYYATPERFIGVSATKFLTGGTTVKADVFQNSGGALTMTGAIWIYRVG